MTDNDRGHGLSWDDDHEWWQKEWFLRSRLNHEHDPSGKFLKPTPRRCEGFEPENKWPDSYVFWGSVILFALLVIFGRK